MTLKKAVEFVNNSIEQARVKYPEINEVLYYIYMTKQKNVIDWNHVYQKIFQKIIILGYIKHKDFDMKIRTCSYAYQSYQHLLNDIKTALRMII